MESTSLFFNPFRAFGRLWRRKQRRTAFAVNRIVAIILACLFTGCDTSRKPEKIELVVWGLSQGEYMVGTYAAIDAFERAHPNVDVVPSVSGRILNPQKLMTAIVGGVPPDVIFQDRFTIGGWASRDAFTPLDSFIVRDGHTLSRVSPEDFYPATWSEAAYKGKVYAIPYDVDVRVLFYNKTLLRQAGFVDRHGEVIPPRTWDDLVHYNKKLTVVDKLGSYRRIGFLPLYGPGSFYLYGWQNGARFMSEDGKHCELTDPRLTVAMQWLVDYHDALGGMSRAEAYMKSLMGLASDPFVNDQLAMVVDGNWAVGNIARYRPDMDFGIAPAPVPAGQPYITWSGGFSLAIPSGAKHPELAWQFIKWMSSTEAWRIRHQVLQQFYRSRGTTYVPVLSANRKTNEMVLQEFVEKNPDLKENYKEGLRVCVALLPQSKFRPVTPAAETLWDQLLRATNYAMYHLMSPAKALAEAERVVEATLERVERRVPGAQIDWWLMSFLLLSLSVPVVVFALWRKRQVRIGKQTRRALFAGLFFISPWAIGFLFLWAVPVAASIVLSFTTYDVLHPARWAGFGNYVELFTEDPLFWKSLWNTAFMIIEVPLGLTVGLMIALLLNAKLKGIAVYRAIFYLPAVVPLVASSILWIWLFQPSNGLINSALRILGIEGPAWLWSPVWSKPSIILMGLWSAGSGMIIWLAGLRGISDDLYEAAEIDGAGQWAKFFYITLPMLTPYIFYNMVMGLIGTLQIFTSAYIMTQGGPVDSTLFYVYHIFNGAFRYFRMGYASALAWVLFVIIMLFTLVQMKLSKKWVYYEEEGR